MTARQSIRDVAKWVKGQTALWRSPEPRYLPCLPGTSVLAKLPYLYLVSIRSVNLVFLIWKILRLLPRAQLTFLMLARCTLGTLGILGKSQQSPNPARVARNCISHWPTNNALSCPCSCSISSELLTDLDPGFEAGEARSSVPGMRHERFHRA